MPPSPFEGSDRRSRLPANWPQIRAQVLRRDGHRCQWLVPYRQQIKCGALAREVDHVVRGDDHRLDNLQALCSYHHRLKTGAEGGRAAAEARLKRLPPPHYTRPR